MNKPRLQEKYEKEIVPAMMEKFKRPNALAVPRLEKIVVNMGVGEALTDVKILDKAMEELGVITGQKPLMRRARIAISNFKVKENNPVGCKVTLRRTKMYEFLDRLISIALPRIRDFRGVPLTSFDREGNYALGLTEQTIFPEIEYDRITRPQGMDIIFVIRHTRGAEESRELLKLFGMPFKEKE
ncbi:MAG: 50S ribosomal protein L5 [Deltaproteobacteria bacterium]